MQDSNALLNLGLENVNALQALRERLGQFRQRLIGVIPADKEIAPDNPKPAENFNSQMGDQLVRIGAHIWALNRELDNLEIFLPVPAQPAPPQTSKAMQHYTEDKEILF